MSEHSGMSVSLVADEVLYTVSLAPPINT